jgi:hypothetical protein
MIQSIIPRETNSHISEVEREHVEDGQHVELDVGNLRLFVTTSGETTSVVLADERENRQSSIIVEDEMWMMR